MGKSTSRIAPKVGSCGLEDCEPGDVAWLSLPGGECLVLVVDARRDNHSSFVTLQDPSGGTPFELRHVDAQSRISALRYTGDIQFLLDHRKGRMLTDDDEAMSAPGEIVIVGNRALLGVVKESNTVMYEEVRFVDIDSGEIVAEQLAGHCATVARWALCVRLDDVRGYQTLYEFNGIAS